MSNVIHLDTRQDDITHIIDVMVDNSDKLRSIITIVELEDGSRAIYAAASENHLLRGQRTLIKLLDELEL